LGKVKPIKSICWTALPLLMASPAAALAQPTPEELPPAELPVPRSASEAVAAPTQPPVAESTNPLLPGDPNAPIQFSADRVEYDQDRQIVTASGEVFMFREGYRLLADRVIWRAIPAKCARRAMSG
jgi:LPS-assembly protein